MIKKRNQTRKIRMRSQVNKISQIRSRSQTKRKIQMKSMMMTLTMNDNIPLIFKFI
jgi:hypothetical protein